MSLTLQETCIARKNASGGNFTFDWYWSWVEQKVINGNLPPTIFLTIDSWDFHCCYKKQSMAFSLCLPYWQEKWYPKVPQNVAVKPHPLRVVLQVVWFSSLHKSTDTSKFQFDVDVRTSVDYCPFDCKGLPCLNIDDYLWVVFFFRRRK